MHYLDNSATTVVSPKAAQKALEIMTECFGNPSSRHSMGIEAEHELNRARKIVAEKIGATGKELFFTSGGTEANNLALFGAAEAKKRTCDNIVISSVEHSSVLEAADRLEQDGWKVSRITPRNDDPVIVHFHEEQLVRLFHVRTLHLLQIFIRFDGVQNSLAHLGKIIVFPDFRILFGAGLFIADQLSERCVHPRFVQKILFRVFERKIYAECSQILIMILCLFMFRTTLA